MQTIVGDEMRCDRSSIATLPTGALVAIGVGVVALLRARGAAHRIAASERASRFATELSAAEARAAAAEAESAESKRLLSHAQKSLSASKHAQRMAEDAASRAAAGQRAAERGHDGARS